MKTLKKTIALLLALAAICSMAACGKSSETEDFEEDEKREEHEYENDRTTDDPEEDTDWETVAQPEEEIEENGSRYESDVLVPYAMTAEAKDIFDHYADDEQRMFYTTDGQLYDRGKLVPMPEGYDTSQLVQALCGPIKVLRFSDGSVYTLENGEPVRHEQLSEFDQEGHLKKVFLTGYLHYAKILVLMDDHVLYTVEDAKNK